MKKNTVYLKADREPIVDREVWEKAQKPNPQDAGSALRGRIICADCGSPMVRRTLKGREGNYKAWQHHCGSRNVREEKIINCIGEDVGSVARVIVGKEITVEQA